MQPIIPSQRSSNASKGSATFASVLTLASWRVRSTWFLLCMILLGMIAAVTIASALPLFSSITTTAGLRDVLRNSPTSSEINLNITTVKLSSRIMSDVQKQFDPLLQHKLGAYSAGPAQISLQANNFSLISPRPKLVLDAPEEVINSGIVPDTGGVAVLYSRGFQGYLFRVEAALMQQAASHVHLVAGRIPRITNNPGNELEILLTPQTAQALGVQLNSVMTIAVRYYLRLPDYYDPSIVAVQYKVNFKARVVGLFTVDSANLSYWHGTNFEPYTTLQDRATTTYYSALFPLDGLLGLYNSIARRNSTDAPYTIIGDTLSWYYHVDSSHVSISQLDDLMKQLAALKTTFDTQYADMENNSYLSTFLEGSPPPPYPYIGQVSIESSLFSESGVPSNVEQYRSQTNVIALPVWIVALQILALIVFFVSFIATLLIEQQSDTLAILGSRGASGRQIFGAILVQSIGLGIFALFIGIPLSIPAVLYVTKQLLPVPVQDAATVVSNSPLQAAFNAVGYAVLVIVALLLSISLSLVRVTHVNILSARQNTARTLHRPLWQRIHLDSIIGCIALCGYGISLYLASISPVLSNSTKTLITTPLSLIAPFFLLLGSTLLFLRFFPFLLQQGTQTAGQRRSATPILALAQMSRSPHPAMRMILLLILATAFALFSLVFTASQNSNAAKLAAYQAGADFSGSIPNPVNSATLKEQTTKYQAIAGVADASVGYAGSGAVSGGGGQGLNIEVRAVDTSTFRQTAIWPSDASAQPLSSLLSLLQAKRQYGTTHTVVPVIIDTTVANKLFLHSGSTFFISMGDQALLSTDLPCLVVGIVEHIPTTSGPNSGIPIPTSTYSGILLDYQTYNVIYGQETQKLTGTSQPLPINYVWLHTNNDASLAALRSILVNSTLHLGDINDRNAIAAHLQSNPLAVSLAGLLSIGTIATLLLAVLGDLLASWLNVRTRLVNFAVLRALGTSPQQVAGVLSLEQGLIYIIGLLLGTLLGIVLSVTVIPVLIASTNNIQSGLTAQIVLPTSLLLVFATALVIFVIALSMMVRIVSQPSLSQTLRLNED